MPRAGSGAGGSFSSASGFSNPWGSGGGGVYAPTATGGNEQGPSKIGTFRVDVTTPAGFVSSLQESAENGSDLIAALGDQLFGEREGSWLGGVPVVGALGRALGDNPVSKFVYEAPGSIGNIVGGALERIPAPLGQETLNMQFDAMPDSPEKRYVEEQIKADPARAGHLKYQFLMDTSDAMQTTDPQLIPRFRSFSTGDGGQAIATAGSLADVVSQAMGIFVDVPVRASGRVVAGAKRLNEIDAIAQGGVDTGFLGTGFLAGPEGLTEVEQIAYSQWKAGVWSRDQAADFLTASGSGFSRNPVVEIAASVALDPTVSLSLGAAGLAKLGVAGVRAGQAAAAGAKTSKFLQWYGKNVYGPLEGAALGKAAKVTRTIIDPLHAVGKKRVTSEAVMDVMSEGTVRAGFDAYGFGNTTGALRWAHGIDPGLYDDISRDFGVYMGNVGRNVEAQAAQRAALVTGLGEHLLETTPKGVLTGKFSAKDFLQLVKDEAAKNRVVLWDEAAKRNLAERMASIYGRRAADEYLAEFAKMNDDTLGFLHATTYGAATREFLDAVARSTPTWAGRLPLQRLVLLNRDTLTDLGARGLLEEIAEDIPAADLAVGGFKTKDEFVAALIRDWQGRHPELRYVTIRDGAEMSRSIDRFERWLKGRLDKGVLPSQVTNDELAKLPEPLRDFHAKTKGAWSLGFRPEDDLLWGLERDLEGNLYAAVAPWVDHVADGAMQYRPASALLYNVAGMPIMGAVAKAGAKPLDYIESGMRTLMSGVTSASITENARTRFVKIAVQGSKRAKGGLTEVEARDIFQRIVERAQINKSTARALSESDMWEATRDLVPSRLYDTGQMTRRDLMNMVIDAYEGDLRFVGLTQKLTGRAKTMLAPLGGNYVGQISEGLYPKVKFRWNPVFQMQEKLEPIILNGQRGIKPAFGTKMTEADRLAQGILDRMVETGIIRMSDIDMQELSTLSLVGRDMEKGLGGIAPASRWQEMADVQGTKRVNMLRTFQHQLGGVVRESMEQHQPGLFDRVKASMQATSPTALADDEVAIRYLAEQMLANEVHVNSLVKPGARAADFDAAINTAEWHLPSNIGELRPLNLDFMARRLAIPVEDGKVLGGIRELRAALADGKVKWERIEEALVAHNAHPDYIARVQRALDFHWDPFWMTVKDKYNLSSKQVTSLQNMMAAAAKQRGMTPVEFVSQVYSPYIGTGSEAVIEDLGKAVNILQAPAKGGGTPEMLMEQLADTFASHLDPSGREALLDAWERALPKEINDLMTAGGKRATRRSQELQKTLEGLRGGWTKDDSRKFAKAVLARMADETATTTPDVERAVQQFAKWSKEVLKDGLLTSGPNPYSELLERVARIPTDAAVPYNHTKQLMMETITQQLRLKEEDAFRLQYFARNRSFLQRSVNHPFFGIYPASYMWGKVLPELARFVAREPFGIRTGAAAYGFMDLQKAIAIQREFDPEFEEALESIGRNEAIWMLGYMTPSLPWDVGAAAPNWLRDIATQADENADRVARGRDPLPLDFSRTLRKVGDYLSPARPALQVNEALGGLGDLLEGKEETSAQPQGPVAPRGPTPATQLAPLLQDDVAPLLEILAKAAGS